MTNTTTPNYTRRRVVAGLIVATILGLLFGLLLHFYADRDADHFGRYPWTPAAAGCHEEDACWNPATMGDGSGFVCSVEPDGTIQRWHDTVGVTGAILEDCP